MTFGKRHGLRSLAAGSKCPVAVTFKERFTMLINVRLIQDMLEISLTSQEENGVMDEISRLESSPFTILFTTPRSKTRFIFTPFSGVRGTELSHGLTELTDGTIRLKQHWSKTIVVLNS